MSEFDVRNLDPVPVKTIEDTGYATMLGGIELAKGSIDPARFQDGLDEAIATWRTITDPETDKPFEIAVINADSTSGNTTLFSSTYRSSISNNPGNLVEFAQSAAARPQDEKRVYVAALGNGGSSYLDNTERKYFRRTGRLTWNGEGRPVALGTVQALSRALRQQDLLPNRFSADSAGAALSTALMTAVPESSISHAYFKGRTNLADRTVAQLVRGMFYTEQFKHQPTNTEASSDPWQLTAERVDAAVKLAERIYEDPDSHGIYNKKIPAATKEVKKLVNDMLGYRLGYNAHDPAVIDTRAALFMQPELQLTLHCSELDPLYGETPRETLDVVSNFIGRLAAGPQVQALIVPGTHSDHAAFPTLRAGAENYAFAR